MSSLYVVSFHAAQPKHIAGRLRDDPVMIKFRMQRITLLSVVLVVALPVLLPYLYPELNDGLFRGTLLLMPNGIEPILQSLGLICSLYLGSIVHYLIQIKGNVATIFSHFIVEFLSLEGFRDHVFAPITEELFYRSILHAILLPVCSIRNFILYSPMFFGIAHIHHGIELYYYRHIDLKMVLVTVVCQFAYTTLFGILANHVFIEYGTVWCPIVIHCVCNLIGFPDLVVVDNNPMYAYGYYALQIAGIVIFTRLL